MAATGQTWTTVVQGAIEANRGTYATATRVCGDVMDPVVPQFKYEKLFRDSQRASLHPFFNAPITTKSNIDLGTINLRPTFESMPWWLKGILNGAATAVVTNGSAYTWTFTPTGTTDNLSTYSLECSNDTQAYRCLYGVIQKATIGLVSDGAATFQVGMEAQQAIGTAITGALTPVSTWEEVNGSKFTASVDSSTIGSTTVTNIIDAQLEVTNNWVWQWTGDGNLYPNRAYRQKYATQLTVTSIWDSLTELTAFLADTQRKIRVAVAGTNVAGASPATARSLTLDNYGYWKDFPISEQNGLWVYKSVLQHVYDTTATTPLSVAVVNGLATLP